MSYLDLRPEPQKLSQQIYEVTIRFPVNKPLSSGQDFQKVLQKYRQNQQVVVDNKPCKPDYAKLSQQILLMKDRNWM